MAGIYYIHCDVHGECMTVSGPDTDHPGQGICWDCSPDDDNPVWCPEDVSRTARITQDKFRVSTQIHCPSVDKTFNSYKELEQWAESEGLEPVSRHSRRWREDVVEGNKNAADKEAQADGFKDNEHAKRHLKANKRDILAANRQRCIDEYVEEVGSDERVTIEEGYGALPANG